MPAIISATPIAGHGGVELLVRELVKGLGVDEPIHLIAPDPPQAITRLGLDPYSGAHLSIDTNGIYLETTVI